MTSSLPNRIKWIGRQPSEPDLRGVFYKGEVVRRLANIGGAEWFDFGDVTVNKIDGMTRIFFPLPQTQRSRQHSPDGFGWGYGGSGPSALAHAILVHAVNTAPNRSYADAVHVADMYYRKFTQNVVASWPRNSSWEFNRSTVLSWLEGEGYTP